MAFKPGSLKLITGARSKLAKVAMEGRCKHWWPLYCSALKLTIILG